MCVENVCICTRERRWFSVTEVRLREVSLISAEAGGAEELGQGACGQSASVRVSH